MTTSLSANSLELQNVSVAYDEVTAVKQVSFTLKAGEIGCFLGPSGCGKSTLLRAIAGFENVSSGEILLAGQLLSSTTTQLEPEARKIGMVFQDIALFPHLTIQENITFGIQHLSKVERQARVDYLLKLVELEGYQNRYPHSLSGGQQQRIALVRALAPQPKLLLMDEPFSGLDSKLREELVPDIRRILLQEKISAILVTHDQMEAFAMADQVAIIHHGQMHQSATPYDIYHRPSSRFVANFVGSGDFLKAKVCDEYSVESDLGRITSHQAHGFYAGDKVDVLIRPDDVLHQDESEFKGKVRSRWFRGSHFLYQVELASGQEVCCLASSHHNHQEGESIGLALDIDHLVLFPLKDGPDK